MGLHQFLRQIEFKGENRNGDVQWRAVLPEGVFYYQVDKSVFENKGELACLKDFYHQYSRQHEADGRQEEF